MAADSRTPAGPERPRVRMTEYAAPGVRASGLMISRSTLIVVAVFIACLVVALAMRTGGEAGLGARDVGPRTGPPTVGAER